MTSTVKEIINQLEKRRQRLRSWVTQDSHPLVIDQVRDAHAALGAMAGILGEMAPAMSRLLVDAIDNEQRMQSLREEQKDLQGLLEDTRKQWRKISGELTILLWSHFVPSHDTWFDKFVSDWGQKVGVTIKVNAILLRRVSRFSMSLISRRRSFVTCLYI